MDIQNWLNKIRSNGPSASRLEFPGLSLDLAVPDAFRAIAENVSAESRSAHPSHNGNLHISISATEDAECIRSLPKAWNVSPSWLVPQQPGWRGFSFAEDGQPFYVLEYFDGSSVSPSLWHLYAPTAKQIVIAAPLANLRYELNSFRVVLYELLSLTSTLRAIHGSAVRLGSTDQGALFVGASGSGKSSCAFGIARLGGRIVSSDIALLTGSGDFVVRRPEMVHLGLETIRLGLGALVHFATLPRSGRGGTPMRVLKSLREDDRVFELDLDEWWESDFNNPPRLSRIYFVQILPDATEKVTSISLEESLALLEPNILPFTVRTPGYKWWVDSNARMTFWEAQLRSGVKAYKAVASLDVDALLRNLLAKTPG